MTCASSSSWIGASIGSPNVDGGLYRWEGLAPLFIVVHVFFRFPSPPPRPAVETELARLVLILTFSLEDLVALLTKDLRFMSSYIFEVFSAWLPLLASTWEVRVFLLLLYALLLRSVLNACDFDYIWNCTMFLVAFFLLTDAFECTCYGPFLSMLDFFSESFIVFRYWVNVFPWVCGFPLGGLFFYNWLLTLASILFLCSCKIYCISTSSSTYIF